MTGFRPPRMGLGRRLIGWIAAYAFILHAVLAGIVATQALRAQTARGSTASNCASPVRTAPHSPARASTRVARSIARLRAACLLSCLPLWHCYFPCRCGVAPFVCSPPIATIFCAEPVSAAAHLHSQPDAFNRVHRIARRARAQSGNMEGAMSRRIAFYSGLFALLLASPAFAHHPGGASNTGGAGPINTISATTLEAGHGAVAFLTSTSSSAGSATATWSRRQQAHPCAQHRHNPERDRERRLRRHRRPDGFGAHALCAPHRHPRRSSLAWAGRQHGRLSRRFLRARRRHVSRPVALPQQSGDAHRDGVPVRR